MKPRKTFIVERKSGRRRVVRQPNSIWGDTDLKALARKAEAEAPHLFGPASEQEQLIEASDNHQSAQVETPVSDAAVVDIDASALSVVPPAIELIQRHDNDLSQPFPVADDADAVVDPKPSPVRRRRVSTAGLGSVVTSMQGVSVETEPDDQQLALLEEENRQLKRKLAQHLLDQNIQLRGMLARFEMM